LAVTIDAAVGGASANSFVTLAEAAAYLEGRLNASTWETDATTDNKNRALVEATRELTVLGWKGSRADDTQALSWPRQWAVDPDASVPGVFYASTEVPQRVKDATMELAFQFIKSGTTDVAALPSTDGVISKTIDVISTTYADPSQRARGLQRFPRVYSLIAPLLAGAAAGRLRVERA
jgi:hypothetical protein